MKTILVRYTVRAETVAENERLIRAVFDELRTTQPDGLRYEAFTLEDGASFVHMAIVDTADGSNPLTSLPAFARFTEAIEARCVDEPVTMRLVPVDGYGPGSTADRATSLNGR